MFYKKQLNEYHINIHAIKIKVNDKKTAHLILMWNINYLLSQTSFILINNSHSIVLNCDVQ